jgi:hypothetical protein
MPIDRGIIDQQLQALRESPGWWDQREFRDLPAVLHADENIIAISRGKIARVRWLRRSWLIVVTDRRLLFIRSTGRTGWRQLEVGAHQITRVALRVGLFRGRVRVMAGTETYRLLVPRADAYKLMSALSSLGTPSNEAFFGFAPARMVRRVMDHVLALPAAALNPDSPRPLPAPVPGVVDQRVQSLEEEVQELRQQIDFMEQLLRQRQPALNEQETRRTS